MFSQFRACYPNGSLLTELSGIDRGMYIVRCLVQLEGTTLVTALAAAPTVELAEDQARERALAILGISTTKPIGEKESLPVTSEVKGTVNPTPLAPTTFSDAPSVVAAAARSESPRQVQPTLYTETSGTSDTSSLPFSDVQPEVVAEVAEPTAMTPLVSDEIPFADEVASAEVEPYKEVETPIVKPEKKRSSSKRNETPVTSYSPNEPEQDTSGTSSTASPVDFSDIIARTNVELKRLGWTNQQGRDYLVQTYGKRSRQLLTDDELLDFLRHLESEPSPE